ncbi:MAG TPA: MgtC/SapB family protein [Geobacteraceae bacterium]|nr:MgtC/SapB family protein [Geobacteraceae bacterium]
MELCIDSLVFYKLLLAAFLGAVIGLEREIHGRPAGFRTHLLVSLGSCLFVIASIRFYTVFGNFSGSVPVGVDPGRVAAQVVTGIGFLGAGAIIREKFSVRGLTTAACLWIASAIGLACGVGLFGISMLVTVISLISLLLLKRIEAILKRDSYVYIRIWCEDRPDQMQLIRTRLEGCNLHLLHTTIEKNIATSELHVVYQVKYNSKDLSIDPVDAVSSIPGMKRVAIGGE